MKQFIAASTEHGINTGWRFFPENYPNPVDNTPFDLLWGNCRDVNALRSLIAEMRASGYEFDLAPETLKLMEAA